MMRRKRWAYALVMLLLGASASMPRTSIAQAMRTLEISDGVVRIDGRVIPPGQLPEGLQTEGVDLNFSWTGVAEPVIEIGGTFYALGADGLKPTEPDFVHRGPGRYVVAPDAPPTAPEPPTVATWYISGAEDPATRKQVEQLYVQAREMSRLSEQLERERIEDRERLADEMRKQAEMARQMAIELPRINVESYWDSVRETDEVLYNRLQDEYHLESRIQGLAARVRSLTEGGERKEALSELRGLLDRAFELKQENRRREIQHLEQELETLQDRLKEREALREKIIERRLRELVGESR